MKRSPKHRAWTTAPRPKTILRTLALAAGLIIFYPLSPDRQVSAQNSQRIVAIVNDEIISGFDLSSRLDLVILSSQLPKTPQVRKRISSQVLRRLIDDKLRLQEARRLKITVGEAEFDAAVRSIEKNNRMKSGGMIELLKRNNIDRIAFSTQIEATIAWQKIIRRQVRGRVNISDETIDDAISRMKDNKGKPEYLISEIFIPFETGKPVDQTKKLAERLYQQIAEGANFDALARTFSQSATAAAGGNLGWIRKDQLDPELSEVVVKMKRGSVSKPIHGPDGFYVLVLRNQRISEGLPQPNIIVDLQQVFLALPKGAPKEIAASQMNWRGRWRIRRKVVGIWKNWVRSLAPHGRAS